MRQLLLRHSNKDRNLDGGTSSYSCTAHSGDRSCHKDCNYVCNMSSSAALHDIVHDAANCSMILLVTVQRH